jgi:general secretion pathway protein F
MVLALGVAVDRGEPLAPEMRGHPQLFSPLEIALVATGESSGRLDSSLRTLAAELERGKKLRNRLLQVGLYPVLLLHAALIIPTLGMVWAPYGFGAYLTVVLTGLLLFWGTLAALASAHAVFSRSAGYGRVLLRLPGLGAALLDTAVARFSRALSVLHGAGLPLHRCVFEAAEVSGNGWTRARLASAVPLLEAGSTLSDAIRPAGVLPPQVYGLLATGEQSGDLERSMGRAADLMEERAGHRLARGVAILPILLTLIVGLVVAIMALNGIGGHYRRSMDAM